MINTYQLKQKAKHYKYEIAMGAVMTGFVILAGIAIAKTKPVESEELLREARIELESLKASMPRETWVDSQSINRETQGWVRVRIRKDDIQTMLERPDLNWYALDREPYVEVAIVD